MKDPLPRLLQPWHLSVAPVKGLLGYFYDHYHIVQGVCVNVIVCGTTVRMLDVNNELSTNKGYRILFLSKIHLTLKDFLY